MEGYAVLQMKGLLPGMKGGLTLEMDALMVPGQSVWCPVGGVCICLMDGGYAGPGDAGSAGPMDVRLRWGKDCSHSATERGCTSAGTQRV